MMKAKENLEKSSTSFNAVIGELKALTMRFDYEYSVKSEYYKSKIESNVFNSHERGFFTGVFLRPFLINTSIPLLKKKLNAFKQFYNDLKALIEQTSFDIIQAKQKLQNESGIVGSLRTQTEETKTYISLDDIDEIHDEIAISVLKLINKCKTYRQKYENTDHTVLQYEQVKILYGHHG